MRNTTTSRDQRDGVLKKSQSSKDIESTFDLLSEGLETGEGIEIRAFSKFGMMACYFDEREAFVRQVQRIDKDEKTKAIYVTLNPIPSALMSQENGSKNKAIKPRKNTTKDNDIERRRLILIDLDPKREANTNATNKEKDEAEKLSREIASFLKDKGFPEPVRADSGNGFHLLYRIKAKADKDSKATLSAFLKALSVRFSSDAVDVDTGVFNASRISKLYGTMTRKGRNTKERPHRRSSILSIPSAFGPVPWILIQEIANEQASKTPKRTRKRAHKKAENATKRTKKAETSTEPKKLFTVSKQRAEKYIKALGLDVSREGLIIDDEGRQSYRWEFRVCPWNKAHDDRAAFVIAFDSGALHAGCQHNGCKENRWREFKILADGGERASELCNNHLTDLSNAKKADELFAGQVVFMKESETWYRFDGIRFEEVGPAPIRNFFAHDVSQYWLNEAEEARGWAFTLEENEQKEALKVANKIQAWGLRCQNNRATKDGEETFSRFESVRRSISDFDANPNILPVRNGILELGAERRGFRDASPDDLVTKRANVDFDPKAKAPRWLHFLETSQPDADVRAYLQRIAGYTLTGSVREELFWVFYGEGRNGKGTFVEVLLSVLGLDYSRSVSPSIFMETRNGDGGGPSPDKMKLRGLRLATYGENDDKQFLNSAKLKSLTGGDTADARPLYGDPVNFEPTFKLILHTNEKPRVKDTSSGIWRRLKPVFWPSNFTDETVDRDLKPYLKSEAERAGILNWMLRGLRDYQENGLQEPASITKDAKSYRQRENSVGLWLEEIQETTEPGFRFKPLELFRRYASWSDERRYKTLGERSFYKELMRLGAKRKKSNSVRWVSLPEPESRP